MAIYCKKNRSGAWEPTDSTTFDNLPDDEKCSSRTETTCNFCGTATGVYCVKNRAGNWEPVSKVDYDRRTNDDEKCESSTETTCDFCSTPAPSTSSYTNCNGPTYKKWCKDSGARYRRPNPSGMIYKLQGCIGVYQDSFFGPKTEKALKDAFNGKTQITDEEIDELCKTTDQGQQTTTQLENWGKEDWEKLITSGEISPNSFIKSRTDGTHVAIQKIDRAKLASGSNDDVPREPKINSTKEITDDNLTKYAYLVLFPPKLNSNELKGDIKEIRRCKNSNNLCLVGPDPSSVEGFAPDEWTWTANPPEDIISEAIKRKLNQLLREQSLNLPGYGPQGTTTTTGTQGTTTTTGTQGTTTTTGTQGTTTTTPAKLDPEKVSKVIEPIKQETIVALEEIQNNTVFKMGTNDSQKAELQQAIDLLNDFDSSKACEQENVDMINNNIKLIDGILIEKQTELNTIVGKKLKQNLLTVKGNLEKVKSECIRLQKQLQSSSGSGTQGTTTQGTTTSTSGGDTDLRTMFGFVGPDGKTYSPKAKIKSIDRKGGELAYGTIQNAINNSDARSYYFAEYNDLIDNEDIGEDYKLRFPDDFPEAEYAGQLIDKDNESALYPLEDMALSGEFVKRTFGNFLGTNSKLELIVSKRQGSTMQSARQKCPYNQETIRTYIIDYLYRGLTPDNRPASNEKNTLCACYSEGMFNDFEPITKDELGSVADNLKPFGLLNRKLNFKEITKLIQGGTVSGKELSSVFVDSNFATKNCKGLRESKLNRNINSLITEAVTTKRKERTREVIVEDLLRTIRGY